MQNAFNISAASPEKLGQQLLEQVCKRAECDVPRALALIEQGAAVETKLRGSTPLSWAAFNNHPSIAQALVDRGADLDALDSTNKTALDWAEQFNNRDVIKIIENALELRRFAAEQAAAQVQNDFDNWRERGMPLEREIIVSKPLRFRT
jgi:ankyrin repeat protein